MKALAFCKDGCQLLVDPTQQLIAPWNPFLPMPIERERDGGRRIYHPNISQDQSRQPDSHARLSEILQCDVGAVKLPLGIASFRGRLSRHLLLFINRYSDEHADLSVCETRDLQSCPYGPNISISHPGNEPLCRTFNQSNQAVGILRRRPVGR